MKSVANSLPVTHFNVVAAPQGGLGTSVPLLKTWPPVDPLLCCILVEYRIQGYVIATVCVDNVIVVTRVLIVSTLNSCVMTKILSTQIADYLVFFAEIGRSFSSHMMSSCLYFPILDCMISEWGAASYSQLARHVILTLIPVLNNVKDWLGIKPTVDVRNTSLALVYACGLHESIQARPN
jgi:hypothetical protein